MGYSAKTDDGAKAVTKSGTAGLFEKSEHAVTGVVTYTAKQDITESYPLARGDNDRRGDRLKFAKNQVLSVQEYTIFAKSVEDGDDGLQAPFMAPDARTADATVAAESDRLRDIVIPDGVPSGPAA